MQPQMMFNPDGTKFAPVHWLVRIKGEWRIACNPNCADLATKPDRQRPWLRTDERRAVTCPLCLAVPIAQVEKEIVMPEKKEVVHFVFRPSPEIPWQLACSLKMNLAGIMRSEDTRAVTCQDCIRSRHYLNKIQISKTAVVMKT